MPTTPRAPLYTKIYDVRKRCVRKREKKRKERENDKKTRKNGGRGGRGRTRGGVHNKNVWKHPDWEAFASNSSNVWKISTLAVRYVLFCCKILAPFFRLPPSSMLHPHADTAKRRTQCHSRPCQGPQTAGLWVCSPSSLRPDLRLSSSPVSPRI